MSAVRGAFHERCYKTSQISATIQQFKEREAIVGNDVLAMPAVVVNEIINIKGNEPTEAEIISTSQ